LEQLEKERDALLAEMQEYGIKPEDLDKEIARLDKEVGDLLQKAAELLPEDE
jgi:predicted  nucleic acid-binding Zn-ribbon protein